MNSNRTLFRILTLAVLLLTHLLAQAAEPTSAITYQGSLSDAGEPVNGFVDLTFRLYDSADGDSQIGNTFSVPNIEVTDGVFTAQLDFGTAVFDGADRWLEITVNGVTLTPRRPITPAPMAHFAHRADTSHFAESALSAETAATSEFAETAGEIPGSALFQQDDAAAVYFGPVRIGELGNPQSLQVEGTLASGRNNRANGGSSFVAGGHDNSAGGTDSFIGDGVDNRAAGNGSFLGGGFNNMVLASHSFIGGGGNNQTRAVRSVVAGGILNETTGDNSFVGGGEGNIASGLNSFV